MKVLDFILNSIKSMSVKTYIISLLLILAVVALIYVIGKIIAHSEKKILLMDFVHRFNVRLIRFFIQLFGITFGLIMYWEFKSMYGNDDLIASDILLPLVLLLLGKALYILSGQIGKKICDHREDSNNNRFTTLLVLISLAVLGFYNNIYIGGAITGIILGKFFWFDTKLKDFKRTIKSFKPSFDCLLTVIIPLAIMVIALIVAYENPENLYGVFWDMLTGISISFLVIYMGKRVKKTNYI